MALALIMEAEGGDRQHRKKLQDLIMQTEGVVRIASAYVTDTGLLSSLKDRDIRLLTYISRMDLISGASSLESLAALIRAGVQCRYISEGQRLHAKVYLFEGNSAVVTSANLTHNALNNNLEVGIHISDEAVRQLIVWFDSLWGRYKHQDLDLGTLSKWRHEIKKSKEEYSSLRKRAARRPLLPANTRMIVDDLFKTAGGFFVCNTNRKYSSEDDEKRMYLRGFAAAWVPFNYLNHMKRVEEGDAVFMYAKNVGIIGIGRADGRCIELQPGDPDRVTPRDVPEWRVPVVWLAWSQGNAYKEWKSGHYTFIDVSKKEYEQLRNGVRQHFLNP